MVQTQEKRTERKKRIYKLYKKINKRTVIAFLKTQAICFKMRK